MSRRHPAAARAALAALSVLVVLAGCAATKPQSESSPAAGSATDATAASTPASRVVTLPNGLIYEDIKVGDGAIAESGLTAVLHYTGYFPDGTKFDSSVDKQQPIRFRIGAGQMVRGFDEGVRGMRIGGQRKITVPPSLGYGATGMGGVIPPNATLMFDLELLDLR